MTCNEHFAAVDAAVAAEREQVEALMEAGRELCEAGTFHFISAVQKWVNVVAAIRARREP